MVVKKSDLTVHSSFASFAKAHTKTTHEAEKKTFTKRLNNVLIKGFAKSPLQKKIGLYTSVNNPIY
jgi:hypothetical protein